MKYRTINILHTYAPQIITFFSFQLANKKLYLSNLFIASVVLKENQDYTKYNQFLHRNVSNCTSNILAQSDNHEMEKVSFPKTKSGDKKQN